MVKYYELTESQLMEIVKKVCEEENRAPIEVQAKTNPTTGKIDSASLAATRQEIERNLPGKDVNVVTDASTLEEMQRKRLRKRRLMENSYRITKGELKRKLK